MSDCGCEKTCGNPTDAEYIMVKATPAEATVCKDKDLATNLKLSCLKKDSAYDRILGDISIPSVGNTITATVCNGDLYHVGQWVYFPISQDLLKIVTIIGNVISLRNGCNDGITAIAGNRDPGNIILKDAPFYPVDAPDCETQSSKDSKLLLALDSAASYPANNLVVGGITERIQVVGRVNTYPNNSGVRKVIKRIAGFFSDLNGRIYMEKLAQVDENLLSDYQDLMFVSATKEIVKRKKPVDRGLTSAVQYLGGFFGNKHQAIKGKVFNGFTPIVLKDSNPGGLANNAFIRTVGGVSVSTATPYEETFNLNSPSIAALNILEDNFYAIIDIEVAIAGSSHAVINYPELHVQNVRIANLATFYSPFQRITIPVRVLNDSNKELKVRIETDIPAQTLKAVLTIRLLGVQN